MNHFPRRAFQRLFCSVLCTGYTRYPPPSLNCTLYSTKSADKGLKRHHNETSIPVSKTVVPDELFRCTSTRFLIDEKRQLDERFVKFDIDGLCQRAASLFGDKTKCVSIEKFERNSSNFFHLKMNDGNEVMAKLPCPIAGPRTLTTASEVATLKFLRSRTSIRVPEVLAWDSDATNPTGTEYIIMEKTPGFMLVDKWHTLNTSERYKILKQIVKMEKELVSIKFPAYGSLYLRDSAPNGFQNHPLPSELDPAGLFCIGPSCSPSWWAGNFDNMKEIKDVGPWTSFLEYAQSIPRRELTRIENFGNEMQKELNCFDERQLVSEYAVLLQKIAKILHVLSHDQRVIEVSDAAIWHKDLNFWNIYVSPEDPTKITGIDDWQSSQIRPLFIPAQLPDFLERSKSYKPGPEAPRLPDNFNELTPEEKEQAKTDLEWASLSKYYEMSCLRDNKRAYNAMRLERMLFEPFTYCQIFSHGSLLPLRNCLLRISQNWTALELPGACPAALTDDEMKNFDEEVENYEDTTALRDLVMNGLLTNDTGWVPSERWEVVNEVNKEMFDMFMKSMIENGASPEEVMKKWPFPPKGLP